MRSGLILVATLLFIRAAAQGPPDRLAEIQRKLRNVDDSVTAELLAQADHDPDPKIRRLILDRLGRLGVPHIREALERHAAGDPDAGVALAALERLRLVEARELGALFQKRLALAESNRDSAAVATLTAAHQRWATLARGAMLPTFLQQPPPVFAAVASKRSVQVLALGDFGEETPEQREVAAAVAAWHRRIPFDIGITVGDNFSPDGVTGPADSRWKAGWEALYDGMGVAIFAATGNHDWGFAESPAAEILYSRKSPTWRMPALYYTFTAGPAQFFALATEVFSRTQADWLERELARSRARWKIVYGHHPVYSYGTHGPDLKLRRLLPPALKDRADVYLAGHEHSVQYLKPEGGVLFFVAPAAGQRARTATNGPLTVFNDSFYGFTVMEIDHSRLRLSFVDTEGSIRREAEIRRKGSQN